MKPANIMVTPQGVVKVLDFGLATVMQPSRENSGNPDQSPTFTMGATQAGMIMGTASYMSPGQAAGKPVDKRADIWSFGVVLWEMLTGNRLFGGETISHTLAAVLTKEPDLQQVPERVDLQRGTRSRLTAPNTFNLLPLGAATANRLFSPPTAEVIGTSTPNPPTIRTPAEVLLKRPYDQYAQSMAADGTLLYAEIHPKTGRDLWILSPDGRTSAVRVTPFNEGTGPFSTGPEGAPRRIAYASDESGRYEIYLQSYPGGTNRITVSSGGGILPRWSRDGKELFYVTEVAVVAVAIRTDRSFGAPRRLFERSTILLSITSTPTMSRRTANDLGVATLRRA